MFLITNLKRGFRLRRLRFIRAVRHDHKDCFYWSPILGGSIDHRFNLGPKAGLSERDALRIGTRGYCGPRHHLCKRAVIDAGHTLERVRAA